MKKLALTAAIVLGMGLVTFAGPNGGGLFNRGAEAERTGIFGDRDGGSVLTPRIPEHGQDDNQDAPLGSGIALLTALGAAYLVGKKRREE